MIPRVAVATSGQRFQVAYRLAGTADVARRAAREIAVEQTVEIPEDVIPAGDVADVVVGRIESFDLAKSSPPPLGEGQACPRAQRRGEGATGGGEASAPGYLATISYPVEAAGGELTQLLNVVFGNSSMKAGIRVERIELPETLLAGFRGPRFGREGLRELVGAARRPLFCSAIKPLGLPAAELARQAYEFGLGGIDVVKDDHGLADQPWAPFEERVARCVEAVGRAGRESGRTVLYAPNVTAPGAQLVERARRAKALGAGALLVAPGLVGFGALQALADDDTIGLPILSHPAFLGGFLVSAEAGISYAALIGQVVRLAGADATIYANHGGRFPVTPDDCRAIAREVAAPMGVLRPTLPTPGGGMTLDRVAEMREMYGSDVMYLLGGGLHRAGATVVENCRRLVALALDGA